MKNIIFLISIFAILWISSSILFTSEDELKPIFLPQDKEIKNKEKELKDAQIVFEKNHTYKKATTNFKVTKNKNQESKKTYELISTGSSVGDYQISIISNHPIPVRNLNAFPQIPALIRGDIDNKTFSLTIPVDLGVKDFKIKVYNIKTKEIRIINLQEENIQAGAVSVLKIDSNNIENTQLGLSTTTPPPPVPPIPLLPGT